MDKKKLERWAEQLLDTGRRNNLVSFKDTKASTLEVVFPDAAELFEKVGGSSLYEIFDPKISETDDDLYNADSDIEETDRRYNREEYIAKYSDRLRKTQILAYSSYINPITSLKNIDKKAKSTIEETGVNVAYLAFGFVHWKEHEESNEDFRAPLLLVPVTFSNESAVRPYFMQMAEEEIVVNPTFSFKMQADHNVKLPEYGEDETLDDYLDRVEEAVRKLGWTVSRECKIGIFSFLKINMYRDLMDNQEQILENKNVRVLLGEEGYDATADFSGEEDGGAVQNDLIDLHTVVDADSSQIDAIETAKSGKSFVLQGPPGTGKSQTITNLIAECIADGKKVLFVSEKLAALNVVYDKLKKAGLEEFCLELHSHKANKKDVIAELCRTLSMEKTAVSSRADNEIQAKERAQKQLDGYAKALHKTEPVVDLSPYQLYSAVSHFKDIPDVRYAIPSIHKKDQNDLADTCGLLEEYMGYVPTVGEDYTKNCFYGYAGGTGYNGIMKSQDDFHVTAETARELLTCSDDLTDYGITANSIRKLGNWMEAIGLFENSKTITPGLLDKDRLDAFRGQISGAGVAAGNYLALRENLLSKFDESIFGLDGGNAYKLLSGKYSGFLSRLFSGEYKDILGSFRGSQKTPEKLGYSQILYVSKVLSDYQTAEKTYFDAESVIKAYIGEDFTGLGSDWKRINADLDTLEHLYSLGLGFGNLADLPRDSFETKRYEFVSLLKDIQKLFVRGEESLERIADGFDPAIFNLRDMDLSETAARLGACDNFSGYLDNWYRFRSLLSKMEATELLPYISYVIENDIPTGQVADCYKKAYYRQWINLVFQQRPELNDFSRMSQDQAVQTFCDKDKLQFEINKLKIKADLSHTRPALDMVAAGSPIMTIQREGQKKRKQKNIRTLFAETGELVQILKPCFLMSPLSVSTYLSTGSIRFDTVIFDEASQIFPQDAIGAIYRGRQLIVVGDSRQMPPSNFFNATTEIDDIDDEAGDVTDFESILDICTGCMPQLRLNWHYRSRYEQLISFSNKNFYENSLVTFPSSTSDEKWIGVDYYHVDGLFDRKSKTNRREAEFIVDLIFENIDRYPDRSLGVVAFSISQQELIDKLLNKRRQEDPSKEEFFSSEVKEPFFIKNLETVQGDERDTIIFSVAYGPDAQGRLLMNFGPLNRAGGERRLNVAVTRAKSNVQLVSSMYATDIDLTRTQSVGARLLREYLDYAEHGAVALDRALEVNPFDWFDSDFETEVYDFLTANGFTLDTQVGCSSFRIDLGLKIPGTSKYVLAIECDGATYHSSKNARDRDRLRQQILERMGWKFYRIWSTDWFKNKKVEKERLLDACYRALNNPSMENTSNNDREQRQNAETASTFETVDCTPEVSFQEYRGVDLNKYMNTTDFASGIRDVLHVEAPLSEEWLLQRLAPYFGRTKVTSVVRENYENRMRYMARYGIVRRDHFLYLADQKNFVLRVPGDKRDIKDIAIEELAAGMIEIIRLNMTITKDALYQTLGKVLGVARIGEAISARFDEVLWSINNQIAVSDDRISLK